MHRIARERISSMDGMHGRAACYRLSMLSDDSAPPAAVLAQVAIHSLELVISGSSVDS
jgi:hypothetical protein